MHQDISIWRTGTNVMLPLIILLSFLSHDTCTIKCFSLRQGVRIWNFEEKKIYILNKSVNATPELFAIYIQNYAKIKNANESVS